VSKRDRVDKMPGAIFATHPSEIFERVCCDWALRSVCNAHIRRIKGKRKEQADEQSEG